MSDLTDADLEAMGERCEAVRTEAVRENSPWNPWFMGQAEILATDLSALIAALRAARAERNQEIHLVFDGPPEHVAGRFVEAENSAGESISVGRWEQRGEYWHLIIPRAAEVERVKRLEAFAEWVTAGEPSLAEYDPSDAGRDEALSTHNSGDIESYGILTVYYNMAQKAKAALAELDAGEGPC